MRKKSIWYILFTVIISLFLVGPPMLQAAVTLTLDETLTETWDLDYDYYYNNYDVVNKPLTARVEDGGEVDAWFGDWGGAAIWGGSGNYEEASLHPWTIDVSDGRMIVASGYENHLFGILLNSNDSGFGQGFGGTIFNSGSIAALVEDQYAHNDVWNLNGIKMGGYAGENNLVENTFVGDDYNPEYAQGGMIRALVLDSDVDGDVYDLYGVNISGANGVTNYVANYGGYIMAGVLGSEIDPVLDDDDSDVYNVYGVQISGNRAGLNGVENSGWIVGGVDFNDVNTEGGYGSWISGDVYSIYGVYISDDQAFENNVTNTGVIAAGVNADYFDLDDVNYGGLLNGGLFNRGKDYSDTLIDGSVRDVFGVSINGHNAGYGAISVAQFDGGSYGGNIVDNSGVIEALVVNAFVGYGGYGSISGLHGVDIDGEGAGDNVVYNDGLIMAGVGDSQVGSYGYGGSISDINGIDIDASSAEYTYVNNYGGAIVAGVFDTTVGSAGYGGSISDIYGVNIRYGYQIENTVDNSGFIVAGIMGSTANGDVENIYGVSINGYNADLNEVDNSGMILAGVIGDVPLLNTDDTIINNGEIEDVYGIYVDGDNTNGYFDDNWTLHGGNQVYNSGFVVAGAIGVTVQGTGHTEIENIYGIAIDGNGAFENWIPNWWDGIVLAGVMGSDVRGDVEDIYGVTINGNAGKGHTDNVIYNFGTIASGITDLYGILPPTYVRGDVDGIYGASIYGYGANDNQIWNAASYGGGIIASPENGEYSGARVADQVGSIWAGVDGAYVGYGAYGGIEDIVGAGIEGYGTYRNSIFNDGTITAGVSDSYVGYNGAYGGDVRTISGAAIVGNMADINVIENHAFFDGYGARIEDSGVISAVFSDSYTTGDVVGMAGVAINGYGAGMNSVSNDGDIQAGVTNTSYVNGGVEYVDGVYIEGSNAGMNAVNNTLYSYGGSVSVGTIYAGVSNGTVMGNGNPDGVEHVAGVFIYGENAGSGTGNMISNDGYVWAGVNNSSIHGDVEDVAGLRIFGDGANVNAITNSVAFDIYGQRIQNSGYVSAVFTDSSTNDDVTDFYGVKIAGNYGGGDSHPSNTVNNAGNIIAAVTDPPGPITSVNGDVERIYGVYIEGDDAYENTVYNQPSFGDNGYGSGQVVVGSIQTGVFDSHVGDDLKQIYGVKIDGDGVSYGKNTVDQDGEILSGALESYIGDDAEKIYGVQIDGNNAATWNRVLNEWDSNVEGSGVIRAGVGNSYVGGEVEDVYGIRIEGHNAGNIYYQGSYGGNKVINSGYIQAGVVGDVRDGNLDVAGDVEEIYGVSIDGDNARTNEFTNYGMILAAAEPDDDDDDFYDYGSIYAGIENRYIGGDVEGIYGVHIDGDGAYENHVNNSGLIWSGIYESVINGNGNNEYAVSDIYGVYIEGNRESPVMVENIVDNSGWILAGIEGYGYGAGAVYGGGVDGVYGVYIEGNENPGSNYVNNWGYIEAGVMDDVYVEGDITNVYGVYIEGNGSESYVNNYGGGWISGQTGVQVEGDAHVSNWGEIQGYGYGSPAIVLGDGWNDVTLYSGQALYGEEDDSYSTGYKPGIMYADGYGAGYGGDDDLYLVSDNADYCIDCEYNAKAYGGGTNDVKVQTDTLAAYQIQGFEDLYKQGYGAWVITKYDENNLGTNDVDYAFPVLTPIVEGADLVIAEEIGLEEGLLAIGAKIQVGTAGPDDDDDDDDGYFYQSAGSTLGLLVAPDVNGDLTQDTSGSIFVLGYGSSADIATDSKLLVIPQMPGARPGEGDRYAAESEYAFLLAASINSEYAAEDVTSHSPFFAVTAELVHDVNSGFGIHDEYRVTVERDFSLPAETDNQSAVANAFNAAYEDPNLDEDYVKYLNEILVCWSAEEGRELFNQTGGLVHTTTAVSTLAGLNQYYGTLTERMGGVVSGGPGGLGFTPMMGPMFAQNDDVTMSDAGKQLMSAGSMPSATKDNSQWGLWTKVFGSMAEDDGDDIASQYDYDTYGIAIGFDKKIGAQSLLGVSIGYAMTNTDMDKVDEEVDVDSYQASVYGVYNPDPWYVAGILSYAMNDYDSERNIHMTGEKLDADYDGDTFSGYVEGGYRWAVTNSFDIIPMASFQASYLETDSFKEDGGPSALDVDDNDYTSLVSTLGVRVRKEFCTAAGSRLIPEFRARWAHEFGNDDYSSKASFIASPLAKFTVEGDDPEEDAALLGVGFTAVFKSNLSLYVDYDANLSGDFTEHTGALGLRYRW